MSDGPINRERESHRPKKASTPDNKRVCWLNPSTARSYCGRKSAPTTLILARMVCADCAAALAADAASDRRPRRSVR